jgi:hypothetical protein
MAPAFPTVFVFGTKTVGRVRHTDMHCSRTIFREKKAEVDRISMKIYLFTGYTLKLSEKYFLTLTFFGKIHP